MTWTVRAAVVVHVGSVVAFLVAVGIDVDGRPLLALAGAVLASMVWVGLLRSVLVEASLQLPAPVLVPLQRANVATALDPLRADVAASR